MHFSSLSFVVYIEGSWCWNYWDHWFLCVHLNSVNGFVLWMCLIISVLCKNWLVNCITTHKLHHGSNCIMTCKLHHSWETGTLEIINMTIAYKKWHGFGEKGQVSTNTKMVTKHWRHLHHDSPTDRGVDERCPIIVNMQQTQELVPHSQPLCRLYI